jgi:hypothetical protein
VLTLLLTTLLGCSPTCADACTVVASCGESLGDFPNEAECNEACASQRATVDENGDTGVQDAFERELRCLAAATCDDLAAGACYEEQVWSY